MPFCIIHARVNEHAPPYPWLPRSGVKGAAGPKVNFCGVLAVEGRIGILRRIGRAPGWRQPTAGNMREFPARRPDLQKEAGGRQ
jgi:hypothetical protein